MDKDQLKQRTLISWATGKVSSSISDAVEKAVKTLETQVFRVEVNNSGTNLLKENAENTRGLKGRLDQVIEAVKGIKLGEQSFENTTFNIPTNLNAKISDVQFKKPVEAKIINTKDFKQDFPKEIKVSNIGDIKLPKQEKIDISSLERRLDSLKSSFSDVVKLLPSLKSEKIEFPKQKAIKIPDKVSVKEAKQIITAFTDGLQGVRDDLGLVHNAITELEIPESRGGGGASVVSSPVVSDVGIKALRGVPKSSVVTVSTSATKLPDTPLEYRRSLIIFNNSSNTIYLGGSDVTTSTGLPVSADSYSPPIDAGANMHIYAIAGSSSELRVFEVSSEREGA